MIISKFKIAAITISIGSLAHKVSLQFALLGILFIFKNLIYVKQIIYLINRSA